MKTKKGWNLHYNGSKSVTISYNWWHLLYSTWDMTAIYYMYRKHKALCDLTTSLLCNVCFFYNKALCLLLWFVHCLMLVRSALFVLSFFFFLSANHNRYSHCCLLATHGKTCFCSTFPPSAYWSWMHPAGMSHSAHVGVREEQKSNPL